MGELLITEIQELAKSARDDHVPAARFPHNEQVLVTSASPEADSAPFDRRTNLIFLEADTDMTVSYAPPGGAPSVTVASGTSNPFTKKLKGGRIYIFGVDPGGSISAIE